MDRWIGWQTDTQTSRGTDGRTDWRQTDKADDWDRQETKTDRQTDWDKKRQTGKQEAGRTEASIGDGTGRDRRDWQTDRQDRGKQTGRYRTDRRDRQTDRDERTDGQKRRRTNIQVKRKFNYFWSYLRILSIWTLTSIWLNKSTAVTYPYINAISVLSWNF